MSGSHGLEIRETLPADCDAVVRNPNWTVGDVHRALFEGDAIRECLLEALRELAEGQSIAEFDAHLEEIGVTALDGLYRSVCLDVIRGDDNAVWDLFRYTRQLGQGGTSAGPGITSPTDDTRAGPVPILEEADVTPTVAVVLDERFTDAQETRAEHRRQILSLLVTMADAANVAIVPTGQVQRTYLWRHHRDQLPGSVETQCNPHRAERLSKSHLEQRVAEAQAELGPDSTPVQYLRKLASTGSQTLTYSDFEREFRRSRKTVSTHITQTLLPLELVDTTDWYGEPAATLTHIGERYLEVLDESVGRQIELSDSVELTPKPHNRPCNPANGKGGEDGAGPYTVEFLPPFEHAGAAACATSGDVTLVEAPVEHAEWGQDDHVRYVSYDDSRDEAIVAVRATGGLQYIVSFATALAAPQLFDQALPIDRLEAVLENADLDPYTLRNQRCIGGLSDEALEDSKTLRDTLIEWGVTIEDLTTRHKRADQDDRAKIRSELMKSAHGLVGSIVHLLDVAGVDLTREVRVPNGLQTKRLSGLAETVATAAAIQSKYNDHTIYRQLYETREHKRRQSGTVTVDAEDPFGTHIGGLVIRGKGVDRLQPHLEARFGDDEPLVEDAPEIAVNLTVREASRADVATAASRILSEKNLSITRETTSILHGIAATPHAAARAVHYLESEDRPREVRPDELRYGLAALPTRDILPNMAPSVGKIVAALLEATESLNQTELADMADVSTQTIRNHRSTLESLGLLSVSDAGYRLELSTSDERGEAIVPWTVDDSLIMVLDSLLEDYLPPHRYGEPTDPVGQVLWEPQRPALLEDHRDLGDWYELALRLTGTDPMEESTIRMGPKNIAQQPLSATEQPTGVSD